MNNILNIAGYKFVSLAQLTLLREKLRDRCVSQVLKGTILLAPEGINIMLAGDESAILTFCQWLNCDEQLRDIEFKKSYSNSIPFKRLLIKIKKEIITFAVPSVDPEKNPAPRISPKEFKAWLDENKDMIVLDTRNQCEIAAGKFVQAIDLNIQNFKTFPEAAANLGNELKQKTIVTYCTGGIRCEKAAIYLQQLGFEKIYQLDGGILKYFAECGDAHYQGKCFVFDDRLAIGAD